MPLHDHFRPPLSERRHWHSFHHAWATHLSSQINLCLPAGYFAEPNVKYGIEIDVAALQDGEPAGPAPTPYRPPAPSATVPLPAPGDVVEISVFSQAGGPELAGAIELVSPANKDRPESRAAFVNKCLTYLQHGVGVVIVDVVTSLTANLHHALLARLGDHAAPAAPLYAAAYRPVDRDGAPTLDIWHDALRVGADPPTMPLWLRGDLCIPVDLAGTYDRTFRELKMPTAV